MICYPNLSMLINSEQYYQRTLHPYMPWQNTNDLVINNHSHERKLKEVEHMIQNNIKRNKHFINIEYDDLKNSLILDSDEDNNNKEFAMFNPDLIDFDVANSSHVGCEMQSAGATIDNYLIPNDQFYEMC